MAQQTIGIGSIANDGLGDPLRTAFTKVNANDTELYAADASRVVGPSSATDDTLVKFDGTTGKLVKQGPAVTSFAATLLGAADAATARTTLGVNTSTELATETKTLTNKTLTAPVISTIVNSGTLTLPTSTGTLALTSDITGTNSGTNTGDQFLFRTISVSGQSDIVADSTTDTLTLVAGGGVTLTTNATTDSLTISLSGGVGSGDMLAGNNLSDLTNTATARTNLGVAIGTNVQAYDADLDSWSSVTRAAGFDTFAATPSSANLASLVTNETGSGALVFATSPTLVTPALGTPSSGTLDSCTATTQSARNNSTSLASTAYVDTATREKLSAARTYYVRTDGNDSNTGLVDSSGGAFLTIQAAVNAVSVLDIAGNIVTIQVRDGTYTGTTVLKNVPGYSALGNLVIVGNTGTPANVIISTTNASCFTADSLSSVWDLKSMKVQTTTTGSGIECLGSTIRFFQINYGACANNQIYIANGGYVVASGNYTISGAAVQHIYMFSNSQFYCRTATLTLSGTPAITNFIAQYFNCTAVYQSVTLSGSATGTRYTANYNSVIYTGTGGSASYLPGNVNGNTSLGGIYD